MSDHDTEVDHYLKAVTDLGDTHEIVADKDIYSENGTKLVAAGIRITSKLYEKLVDHKLQLPLDMSLSADPTVGIASIIADIEAMADSNPMLKHLCGEFGSSYDLKQMIADIRLPAPMFFRLTVSKEKFPSVYERGLSSAVLALFVAHCEKMNDQDAQSIAIAALFHNIGMMHVDPVMLAPAYVMSSIERRHIYAHPLTAYMLIKQFPELPKNIAEAVLEHHERMDGRGYPRGLTADKISRCGQILGVAVVATKAFESAKTEELEKLKVTLKVNARQYGNGLIGHIVRVIDQIDSGTGSSGSLGQLSEKMTLIANVFDAFNLVADDDSEDDEILEFTKQRMMRLRVDFLDVGIDLNNIETSVQVFESDPELAHEYIPLVNEAIWQLKSILLEISRRWTHEFEVAMLDDGWLSKLQSLLLAK
ncbi:MAG: HD-GYP domain-containing protein [Methylophilaceae bacterium]